MMRWLAAAMFLSVLMVSGHHADGQESGVGIKHSPAVEAIKDQILQRKKELEREEAELKRLVKKHEARIAFLKKEIQGLQEEEARLLNEAMASEAAAARKSATDDKLDLILKKLESLEKRVISLEKKESSSGGGKR